MSLYLVTSLKLTSFSKNQNLKTKKKVTFSGHPYLLNRIRLINIVV